jgi:hypothetical protein
VLDPFTTETVLHMIFLPIANLVRSDTAFLVSTCVCKFVPSLPLAFLNLILFMDLILLLDLERIKRFWAKMILETWRYPAQLFSKATSTILKLLPRLSPRTAGSLLETVLLLTPLGAFR